MQRFAKGTRRGMLVLDAGAGRGPYRGLFTHARYEACDFAQLDTEYVALDYVCDISDIPVKDGRFDRVVFNQVLEHLPHPGDAVRELYRVTKPGGRLFCSVPLFYAEHQQPWDFHRFTQYGLRRLFEEAGFDVVRLTWLEGYLGTVSYQFTLMGRQLPDARTSLRVGGWRGLRARVVVAGTRRLAPHLAREFARLDIAHRHTDRGMPKNYVIVVRKPG